MNRIRHLWIRIINIEMSHIRDKKRKKKHKHDKQNVVFFFRQILWGTLTLYCSVP